ncbi:MAG: glutamine amidotransferase [Myxococcota bacterium]
MGRPILVLKTGEALPPVKAACGDFEGWIARGLGRPIAPGEVEVAAVHLGDSLPAPAQIAGVVVTGSVSMVSDREPWSERAAAWLARVVAEDAAPVLGLCYGHQLIAHGLGGEVGANPRGREMGTVEVRFPTGNGPLEPLFEAGVFLGHTSHVEAVLRPPPGARILAHTAQDPHSALRYGPRQWGTQFHPEFDAEILRRYVEARRDVLAGEGRDPDAMIAAIEETPELARVLARFGRLTDER